MLEISSGKMDSVMGMGIVLSVDSWSTGRGVRRKVGS